MNQRWVLIFSGVSAIHISKWGIMVIRAHHWIWEKMDALEALTIHSDGLTDLAFNGATFLYAKRIVTDLTAVIKEGLQLWLPLKSRVTCITLVQAVIYKVNNFPENLHLVITGTFEHRNLSIQDNL